MEKADSPYRVVESSLVDVPELDFSDILITSKGQLSNSSQTWLDYKLYFSILDLQKLQGWLFMNACGSFVTCSLHARATDFDKNDGINDYKLHYLIAP